MMFAKGAVSMPSCSIHEEGACEHVFKNSQQDFVEGGGGVAVEERVNEQALEIPTILCFGVASEV